MRHRFSSCSEMMTASFAMYTQWSEFMSLGAQVPDEVLEHRISQLAPNKCCTLIYTVCDVQYGV